MRCLLIIVGAVCALQPPLAQAQEKSPLPKHFILGKFRVFYTTEGKAAVPPADVDANNVPDHVEDVAKQLWAAHQVFCTVLEFPDPFASERYKGVTCIEARLWERSEIGGGNGVAFENPQRARRIPEGKPDDRALVMSIGKHVDARKNITPAHEFFHLIQYATTYFKNRWYLEGQARWSEHALHTGGLGDVKYSPRGPWPQRPAHLPELFGMTYDAEFVLWNPIARRTDAKGLLPKDRVPQELAELRYSDEMPVVRDGELCGAAVMRDILIELGKLDDVAYQQLGYENWSEVNQKSPKNDRYIYQAIMDALRRHAPPVGRFRAVVGR